MNNSPDSTLPVTVQAVTAATRPTRLLIAASGTGGHVFPAIAVAECLADYEIEWLGVPDRLESQLVAGHYPLHTVAAEGFQKRGLDRLRVAAKLITSIWQVRRLLQAGQFQGVFTTGGYIAAPAVLAARSLGLPVILHESNALPGKVTRFLGPWCSAIAIGFEAAATHLPNIKAVYTGTPVRSQFQADETPPASDLPLPADALLIVVIGGSQGAVSINRLVRQCASAWFDAGFWVVHLTGENDPDAKSLQHPQYLVLPFYSNMAGLLQRADLAISRSGAGTLTELASTHTPSILIPYPYAAEDHQTYNADVFTNVGAAKLFQQHDLTLDILNTEVLNLLGQGHSHTNPAEGGELGVGSRELGVGNGHSHTNPPAQLQKMAQQAGTLAMPASAEQLAQLVRRCLDK